MSGELDFAPITELASKLENKSLSSEELARAAIERTEELEPALNSYITFLPERALAQAKKADAEITRGEYRGPLHGVPMSLKDLFDTAGIPTSAGAAFLREHVPEQDAVVTEHLGEAGAVLMGKSNMNKFAGGESGDNPDFGKMKNPWNLDYSPGGSSGGSGVQVATGMAAFSIGSDNGGSVRIPAALCSVVGLKPTHGRISMEGMFPRAYTLDHPGILTRTVEDCAIVLQVLVEPGGDSTAAARSAPDYRQEIRKPIRGLKVGVDRHFVRVGQPPVLAAFEKALRKLEELGTALVEVNLPAAEEMTALMYTLFFPEWGAAHEPWLRERPEEYGFGGARAALLIPAVDYIKASRKRRVIQEAFARATKGVDVVASPTYPLDRRPFGNYPMVQGRPFHADDALRYTLPYDLLGLPAVSVPNGFSEEGFPTGLQLSGKAFDEATVLRVAHAYEQATDWHEHHPRI